MTLLTYKAVEALSVMLIKRPEGLRFENESERWMVTSTRLVDLMGKRPLTCAEGSAFDVAYATVGMLGAGRVMDALKSKKLLAT